MQMQQLTQKLGIRKANLLLPKQRQDLTKWCVIACDQYTSDLPYWQMVEQSVADAPSTLHMVLPEVYLGSEKEAALVQACIQAMHSYCQDGVLEDVGAGAVLLRRHFNDGSHRTGMVVSLDLECYDYTPGSKALIRATEGTIEDRIPPRLRIREHAPLELPHIMVLIDDSAQTVIEPLWQRHEQYTQLYDSDLGFDMGRIEGYALDDAAFDAAVVALHALYELQGGDAGSPMLYAMGDGNHSFATAKAHWQQVKQTLSEAERETHPARFALCEVVNIHDVGLQFEPIHRVVFGGGGYVGVCRMAALLLQEMGMQATLCENPLDGRQVIQYATDGQFGYLCVENSPQSVEAGTIDMAVGALLQE
ncbi:DUF1015 domain-containing protein, partial [Eubacteriales bacterium OttesenSCG-928-N14]|nr:DUF1015 domain-containing protein [Eubacteriales bacterium OttesenSCG-928-N14]